MAAFSLERLQICFNNAEDIGYHYMSDMKGKEYKLSSPSDVEEIYGSMSGLFGSETIYKLLGMTRHGVFVIITAWFETIIDRFLEITIKITSDIQTMSKEFLSKNFLDHTNLRLQKL